MSVQEQVAIRIAEALNLHLSAQEQQAMRKRYTQNPQAYEEFLIGRSLLARESDPVSLEAARKHFEQALKLDPQYAPALAGLSHVEGYYYRDIDSTQERHDRAMKLAKQALAIDPDLPEAHVALGRNLGADFDYVGAAKEFQRVTETELENPEGWDMLSWALAYQQPPKSVEAEKAAREAIRLNANMPSAQYHLGRALFQQGKYTEAGTAFDRSEELGTRDLAEAGRAQSLAAQGRYDEAAQQLLKRGPIKISNSAYWLSLFYAGAGKKEKSLEMLQKAFEIGFRDFAALDAQREFDAVRDDARFRALMEKYRKNGK